MKKTYPLLEEKGIVVVYPEQDGLPPFCSIDNVHIVLDRLGKLAAWKEWSRGCTRPMDGFYPWDVEDFLKGRPNFD